MNGSPTGVSTRGALAGASVPGEARRPDGGIAFAVFGLVVMATWTLVIKYLAPVLYFVSERAAGRAPDRVPVMWDFWWLAHLALAWLLWHRHLWARPAGLAVSAAEIVIVVVKLFAYARRPDLSFWRLLWFTNKVYVLAYFVALLIVLLGRQGWPGPAGGRGKAPEVRSTGARS